MTFHSQATHDLQRLILTLREVLKAKGTTYAVIGEKVGVSEVTIKRWMTGRGCSLENLFEVCGAVEISFFDLAALAKEDREVDYFLSREQEIVFAKNPALFGFFKGLHAREPIKSLALSWQLNSQEVFRVLRKLEKLDLLDISETGQPRLKTRGNIRYTHEGPLAKAILRPQIVQFLDHVDATLKNKDVCYHSAEVELSDEHMKQFVSEIHQLGAKYRARAYRDKSLLPNKKLNPVRWLFAFAPYKTDWRQYAGRL